jgi:hypothetical protein
MTKNNDRPTGLRGGVIAAVSGAILLATVSTVGAAPVDLSSWQNDGGGNWTLQSGNNAVFQSLNSATTMFHNGVDSQGLALSGTIEVQTTGDNDFIGFALGYHQGDLTNSGADYLLVDWKQGAQAGQQAGLAISRVTGAINAGGTSTGSNAFQHTGPITELARGTTLGNTGWADNTEYQFDITFTSGLVRVFVDGALELQITGSFADGAFAFYNFSQPNVLYAGIQEVVASIPEPGQITFFALGLAGIGFARRRRMR